MNSEHKMWRRWALVVLFMLTLMPGLCFAGRCANGVSRVAAEGCVGLTLKDGVYVDGILFKKRKLDESYILRFSRQDGLIILDSSKKSVKSISSSQLAEAVGISIARIQKSGGRVEELQFDLDVADDLWVDIRSAIRTAILSGSGEVEPKDRAMTIAVNKAIRDSKLLVLICGMVRNVGARCDTRGAFTEGVAFKAGYASRDRKRVAREVDVALRTDYGFAIALVQSKKRLR